jgi:hypothetical protein
MCSKTSGERRSPSSSGGGHSSSSEIVSGVYSTRPTGPAIGGREDEDEGDPGVPMLTGAIGLTTTKACAMACRGGPDRRQPGRTQRRALGRPNRW